MDHMTMNRLILWLALLAALLTGPTARAQQTFGNIRVLTNLTAGVLSNFTSARLTNTTLAGTSYYAGTSANNVFTNGSFFLGMRPGSSNTHELFPSVHTVRTINDLKTLVSTDLTTTNSTVEVQGYFTPNDGGGGQFYYIPHETADNGMTFDAGSGSYSWRRTWDGGPINVLWFGAQPDDDADDTAAVQAAIDFAQNPTYGPGSQSGEAVSAKVTFPAGRFDISALDISGLAELSGVSAQQFNYNNGTSIRQLGSVTNTPLLTLDGLSTFTQPVIENIAIVGRQEANSFSKRSIVSVTSRHVFTVATNDLPTYNAAATTLPHYGFCYFYASDGKRLGVGWVESIDYATGAVTLRDQTDWYATPTSSGLLLDTNCKVIFTEPTTVGSNTGYWSAYAPAGNIGLLIKGSGQARIRNLIIQNFNAGVVFEGGGVTMPMENVSIRGCALFNVGGYREAVTSDHIFNNLLLQGFYLGDYDLSSVVELTNKWYRSTPFALYHPPYGSQIGVMISDGCLWSGIQSLDNWVNIQSLFSDNISVGGWWLERGLGSSITNALNIDTWTLRPRFLAVSGEGLYPLNSTNQVRGLYVPATSTGRISMQVDKIGVFTVYPYLNNYSTNAANRLLDSLFDFPATTKVGVGQFMQHGLLGTTNVYGAQAGRVFRGAIRDDIDTAANAGSGWFYTNSTTASFAVGGTHTLSLDEDGISVGRSTQTTPAISVYGGASGNNMFSLTRTSGLTQSYAFRLGSGSFQLYDSTAGLHGLWVSTDSGVSQLFGGNAAAQSATRPFYIFPQPRSGTDAAGNALFVASGLGSGAGTPSSINFQVPSALASGTTTQTHATRTAISEPASPVSGDTALIPYRWDGAAWQNERMKRDSDSGLLYTGTLGYTAKPYKTLIIPAAFFAAANTSPATATTRVNSTNNTTDSVWSFSGSADNYITCSFPMPEKWDGSTLKAKFFWRSSSTSTNAFIWNIAGVLSGVGDNPDIALGTAMSVTNAGHATAYLQNISSATGTIDPSGDAFAAGDTLRLLVGRDGDGDGNTDAALLEAVVLQYRETATEPSAW
jgi:hypothetical protein